jgi:hypothetical protein
MINLPANQSLNPWIKMNSGWDKTVGNDPYPRNLFVAAVLAQQYLHVYVVIRQRID